MFRKIKENSASFFLGKWGWPGLGQAEVRSQQVHVVLPSGFPLRNKDRKHSDYSVLLSPGHQQQARIEAELLEHTPEPVWDIVAVGCDFYPLGHSACPITCFISFSDCCFWLSCLQVIISGYIAVPLCNFKELYPKSIDKSTAFDKMGWCDYMTMINKYGEGLRTSLLFFKHLFFTDP